MKKILSFILVLFFAVCCLTACSKEEEKVVTKDTIKIGMICLHDTSSTYDANFITAMKEALAEEGIDESQLELCTGVDESEACYQKASELAQSCDIVFADSFGHEDFMIQAAQAYPNVEFCHATGEKAATIGLSNYHNAFAAIYEGRYLAGIAAGQKLNEINEKLDVKNYKVGYVGAYPYAEVISGYTSFFLGVRSVCPEATMEVKYTGSWYDYDKEYAAANALISDGCRIISQHADSYGAPTACEQTYDPRNPDNYIPNVSYNGSTKVQCPNTFVVSTRINWKPYFKYIIEQVIAGEAIDTNWTGTIASGSVEMTEYGNAVADGTAELIDAAKQQFIDGTLKVFNCANFTVDGQHLTSFMANVIPDDKYQAETDVVKVEGEITYIAESYYRSAPYFDAIIDGISIGKED